MPTFKRLIPTGVRRFFYALKSGKQWRIINYELFLPQIALILADIPSQTTIHYDDIQNIHAEFINHTPSSGKISGLLLS